MTMQHQPALDTATMLAQAAFQASLIPKEDLVPVAVVQNARQRWQHRLALMHAQQQQGFDKSALIEHLTGQIALADAWLENT